MNKLEEIVAYKKQELAELKARRPLDQVERGLKKRPAVRDFRLAIHRPARLSLIAEVKKASPSAGPIRPGADPVDIAKQYSAAGAQAISVLTDEKFFSGSLKDLSAVRDAVGLPVLRKDFLLEEYQVVEASAAGADAILLIAAILPQTILKRLLALSRDLSLTALVEVHSERELGQSLEAGAQVIGINNRNLNTLEIDLKTTEQLIKLVPQEKTRISESGLRSRADVEYVQRQGADAVLIGEEFMTSKDIQARVKELMGS